MRSWRSTLIAAVAIPASVISTFGMMRALDFTLNSVTMLALVLMVGVVIDDAIVVLENIFRFIEEKRMRPMEAAREATKDIGLAVLATTLSLVVIFVPVSFMSSISGRFLYQFGITAAVAVMVSLLLSFLLTPTPSARVLGAAARQAPQAPSPRAAGSRGGVYGDNDPFFNAPLPFGTGPPAGPRSHTGTGPRAAAGGSTGTSTGSTPPACGSSCATASRPACSRCS